MNKWKLITCLLLLLSVSTFSPACGDDDDDDSADDDTSPNDDDDDDNDDNDNNDDDNDDSIGSPQIQTQELIAGGAPGYYGTAVGVLPDGHPVVAATKGRALLYYQVVDETLTFEKVADYAFAPDLVIDADGAAHIVFLNIRSYTIDYATNAGGAWVIRTVGEAYEDDTYPKIALHPDGQPRIAFNRHDGDSARDVIVFAVPQGAAWAIQEIDDAKHGFMDRVAFSLDRAGNAHLGYIDNQALRLYIADNVSGDWLVQTAYQMDMEAFWLALAVDQKGIRHLVFPRNDNYYLNSELLYGNDAGDGWTFETIDVDVYNLLGAYPQLLADDSDILHLATIHFDWSDIDPRLFTTRTVYARRIQGTWQFEEFAENASSPVELSLALNAAGEATIAAHDSLSFGLFLFSNVKDNWTTWQVDSAGDAGIRNTLALDAENRSAISYFNLGEVAIELTSFDGETWKTETIAVSGPLSLFSQLLFDQQSIPHVFYVQGSPLALWHAWDKGAGWENEPVIIDDSLAAETSAVIDAQGDFHLVYGNGPLGSVLNYATNASGEWASTVITVGGQPSGDHDLALDDSGNAHVAFYQDQDQSLWYAANASGEWVTQRLDSPGECAGRIAIAVDSAGLAHISYINRSDYGSPNGYWEFGLRYASNASGAWQTELVGEPDEFIPGADTALTLDRHDRPVIAYDHSGTMNWDDGDLCLAWKAADVWQTAILDQPGEVGDYLSLAVDENDLFHVSYYGARGLYYATFKMK